MNQENNNLIYFDRINKESYQYSDYKKFDSIREENIAATNYIDVSGGYNGYGGGYMNYVTQEQFKEYKDQVSARFDNVDIQLETINDKINDIPESINKDFELHFEKMKNTQTKWFIGIILTTLGIAGKVFGLY